MVVNRRRTMSFVVHVVENVDVDDTRSSATAERRADEIRTQLGSFLRAMPEPVALRIGISGVSVQVVE
jgi:hypothetical protein